MCMYRSNLRSPQARLPGTEDAEGEVVKGSGQVMQLWALRHVHALEGLAALALPDGTQPLRPQPVAVGLARAQEVLAEATQQRRGLGRAAMRPGRQQAGSQAAQGSVYIIGVCDTAESLGDAWSQLLRTRG